MTVVAAFDVDGTVTTRDCVVPFLRRVAGTAPMAARLGRSIHRLVPALARRDRDELKVDDVVATELEVGADGRCTGELIDGNCRGPEKARRLLAWLAANDLGRDTIELWAYGDSPGDRELLATADKPVWV